MCRAVRCSKCGKTTWAGCGAHVQQVMGAVPEHERCVCARGSEASASAGTRKSGLLAWLFKKR